MRFHQKINEYFRQLYKVNYNNKTFKRLTEIN